MTKFRRSAISLTGVLTLLASPASLGGSPVELESLDELTSTPQAYDGKIIRVEACLLVSRHDMALQNCNWSPGQHSRLVSFEALGTSDEAYRRLVNAGHANRYKDIVVATVSGEFHFNPARKPNYVLKISGATNIRTIRDSEL